MDNKEINEKAEKISEILGIGLILLWIFTNIGLFTYSARFEYIETKDHNYYIRVDKLTHTNILLHANKSKNDIGYWRLIPRYGYFRSKIDPCVSYRVDRINGELSIEPLILPEKTLCINGKIFQYTYKKNNPLGILEDKNGWSF